MARTIMDVMHENINPVSVSNALYECMVDWRGMVMSLQNNTAPKRSRTKYRRDQLECVLARFFGVDTHEMRRLLGQHFGIDPR